MNVVADFFFLIIECNYCLLVFFLRLMNKEDIKNLLGVIFSSGVEKMILTKGMVLSLSRGGRFVV